MGFFNGASGVVGPMSWGGGQSEDEAPKPKYKTPVPYGDYDPIRAKSVNEICARVRPLYDLFPHLEGRFKEPVTEEVKADL